MTFKEKFDELRNAMIEKLRTVVRIEEDSEHERIQGYISAEHEEAMNAHTNAANAYGAAINKMCRQGYSPDDEYIE